MELKYQDFLPCKKCSGDVQVLLEDGVIVDVLHSTPDGKDCSAIDAVGPDGTKLFIDGVCNACHRPNTFQFRSGHDEYRTRAGHIHPELDKLYKERLGAGEDVDEGIIFPLSALPELLSKFDPSDPDEAA